MINTGVDKVYLATGSTDMRKSINGLAAIVQESSRWLKPLHERMREHLLQKEILHADETTLQVLKEPGRNANSTSYMWLYRTGREDTPIILYDYQTTRAGKHPARFLKGFKGYLHTDGYDGYSFMSEVTLVGCWAHARRYFVDALATRILEVGDGKVESYPGNYADFLRKKQTLGDLSHSTNRVEQLVKLSGEIPASDKQSRIQAHTNRKNQQRREQKQQKELSQVEGQIEDQEEKLAHLEQRMADPELYQDQDQWRKVSTDHIKLKENLDDLYQQWESLQD